MRRFDAGDHRLCSQRPVSRTRYLRDELASRAARLGQSLQEYLRGQLVELAAKPTPDQLWARVRARVETTGSRVTAEQILAAKDADRT